MSLNEKQRAHFGLVVGEFNGRYASDVLWNTYRTLAEHNVDITVIYVDLIDRASKNWTTPHLFEQMIDYDRFDGLIVMTGTIRKLLPLSRVEQLLAAYPNLPIVNIALPMGGHPNVVVDNYVGMTKMMEHLIQECEHKHFAFVQGPELNPEAQERMRAFRDSLRRHNLSFDERWVSQGDFNEVLGEQAAVALLNARAQRPDVIVCANDDMALGVIHGLTQAGINVPEEIGVTGFDNVLMAKYAASPLTTVGQNYAQISQLAVSTLMNLVEGKPIGSTQFEPSLMARESCCGKCKARAQSHAYTRHYLQAHFQLQAEETRLAKALDENGRRLAHCLSADELAKGLASSTMRLDIEMCKIFIYDDMKTPTFKRLLVSCKHGDWMTHEDEPFTRIQANSLISAINQEDACHTLLIPLHFKDSLMGCMAVKVGPQNSRIYESLRGYVASAMRNLIFMQQLQSQNEILEQKVAERTDQLVDLLEQNQDMLGIVAHDLRSPLTIIGIAVDMLRMHRHKLPPDAIERQLSRIRQASDSMLMHIGRLLNENQEGEKGLVTKIESVDLLPLVQQVVAQERVHAEMKQIEIHVAELQPRTVAQVDAQLLMMALSNIVNNAVKYTPEQKCIEVQICRDDVATHIHVIDEGRGLTAQDQAQMFGRYVKLSAAPTAGEKSSGFGLYVVKKMIVAMGGTVSAETRTDAQGSIFTLTFPNLPVA